MKLIRCCESRAKCSPSANSMNRTVFLIVLLSAVFALATPGFAGDYATLNVVGFSKDGRYLAFEEYGVQDGSGFPYSNVYFIDVEKNAFAAPSIAVRINKEMAPETVARKRAVTLAAKVLTRFRIVKGNIGKLVLSHLMTDLTFEGSPEKAPTVRFAEQIGSLYRRGHYELSLTKKPIKTKGCEIFEEDPKLLELGIRDLDADTFKFLQKDTSLPETRGCANDYRIRDVYINKGFVVVFIGVFTQGFEGPDMRYMAVTGKLK